jgi:hypothetical protein
MPTIPWTVLDRQPTTDEVVVMASRLEVRSLRQVPGFFLASLSLWRQALRSPGAVGASLEADLLHRTFWTLSAWTSKEALDTYAGTDPHRRTIARKRAVMRESTFTFWTVPTTGLPIDWSEAQRRLAQERAERGRQN